jgi:hypothetical protein
VHFLIAEVRFHLAPRKISVVPPEIFPGNDIKIIIPVCGYRKLQIADGGFRDIYTVVMKNQSIIGGSRSGIRSYQIYYFVR